MKKKYDLVVVGTGTAASVAASRCRAAGWSVAVIDHLPFGGTCVSVGCVPSKILIRGAQIAHHAAAHEFQGIARMTLAVDRRKMLAQQQARVDELRQAKYQSILDAHQDMTLVRGAARFRSPNAIAVRDEAGGETEIHAERVLVATGAAPAVPPIPGLKETPYWTSTEALAPEEIPGHLVVLSGSVVGLELGQAFRRLGARVTVIELMERLLPVEDEDISRGLRDTLEVEGIEVSPPQRGDDGHASGGKEVEPCASSL